MHFVQEQPEYDLEYRRGVLHLYRLGPRPIAHFLVDLGIPLPALKLRLRRWQGLDPDIVASFGGTRWPRPPLRLVPPLEPKA